MLKHFKSQWVKVIRGVLQGSILGPFLLCMLMISFVVLYSKQISFAEDASLFYRNFTIEKLLRFTNYNLNKILECVNNNNNLSINSSKTEIVNFSSNYRQSLDNVDWENYIFGKNSPSKFFRISYWWKTYWHFMQKNIPVEDIKRVVQVYLSG